MAGCCRLPCVKFLEMAFTIACLTLHIMSLKPADMEHFWLLSVTFVGMLIVECGTALAECIKQPLHCVVDGLYSMLGAGLFLASGAVCLRFWDDEPRELMVVRYGMWKGFLACITCVLFVIDAFRALNGSAICAGQLNLH